MPDTMPGPSHPVSRRRFVAYATALSGLAFLSNSCKPDEDAPQPDGRIPLGADDIGALNYLYAFEQLEVAFFAKLNTAPYTGISTHEQAWLLAMGNHDQAHAAALEAALGNGAISTLEFNFSSIDFNSRDAVLHVARDLKDLAVAAYNGVGVYFRDAGWLGLSAKMESVEARHASVLRELITASSFADTSVLNPVSRIDNAQTPQQVLDASKKFFVKELNADLLKTA